MSTTPAGPVYKAPLPEPHPSDGKVHLDDVEPGFSIFDWLRDVPSEEEERQTGSRLKPLPEYVEPEFVTRLARFAGRVGRGEHFSSDRFEVEDLRQLLADYEKQCYEAANNWRYRVAYSSALLDRGSQLIKAHTRVVELEKELAALKKEEPPEISNYEYDLEFNRLYEIRNDGDRDFMLRYAIRELKALQKRLDDEIAEGKIPYTD